ncbi:leucine-rich repeat-containing G-protein coupled receptor 6-like [Onthophagus taurus]|uniref:leucine-rich repeat-containing G-protein coupled receptor 6-like n=1 Tax=Onthophagus taurus TaxID=166361 RepID=UPI0039BE68A5
MQTKTLIVSCWKFYFLLLTMPGLTSSKCFSTMGKQVVHCTGSITSIKDIYEEIDPTTSVVVVKDLQKFVIDPNEHLHENFKSLTSYQLSRINDLQLNRNAFMGLSNLLIMKFADNNINVLENQIFKGLHSLEILELINCKIKVIDDEAFDGLSNLQSLDLTNNNIKTISKKLFEFTPNLNSLALYKNEINNLDVDCFMYLRKLTTLGLSDNNLQTINAETFNAIPELTYLYVSFNQIDRILGDFKCPKLKFINFNHNNLKDVSRNLFKGSNNLKEIDLGFNQINYIDENAFNYLPYLMHLHLRNCTLDLSKLKFVDKPLIVV